MLIVGTTNHERWDKMIRLTRWMGKFSSAVRVRDRAIGILQRENRELSMQVALLKAQRH